MTHKSSTHEITSTCEFSQSHMVYLLLSQVCTMKKCSDKQEGCSVRFLCECLIFSLNPATISPWGMAPGNEHHDPRTVAARVDSSERECRILDTVRLPREKARSTSVELAKNNVNQTAELEYEDTHLESRENQGPYVQVGGQ